MPCRGGLTLIMLLLSGWCAAHEEEHVRYLTATGVDVGGCDSPATACRTLGYAAGQAGKGGKVKVAAGDYRIIAAEDLFYVWSEAAELSGGYRQDFHQREPTQYPTLLIGVPPERRASLEARGFQVLVDNKWSESGSGLSVAAALLPMTNSSGPAECIEGMAAGHACDGVDLLSHMALADFSSQPTGANDVWGFVDLNTEREYALVGLRNGTAVVDVSDPAAPFEVGTVPGQQTGWRDIKVLQYFNAALQRWQAYAYVTADAAGDFLTIIDLAGLPHRVELATRATADRSAHNLSLAGVDPSLNIPLAGRAPVAYLAGSNLDGGAFRAFRLDEPLNPVLASRSLAGYMHDGTSMVVRDAAQRAGCRSVGEYCEVLADFNEDQLQLWDVTLPEVPQLLSSVTYANASYVHSGSWSEDGRYIYLHDELDERDRGVPTTLYAFDTMDLGSPALAGTWTGPSRAIDHNGYARGNRYYISNYTRGLTILDLTDPAQPAQAGYFDTFLLSDSPAFSGAWGIYPYLPSRAVLVSDIESGLFVLRDRTLATGNGALELAQKFIGVRAGQSAQLAVSRVFGASGAVSVGWELLAGSIDIPAGVPSSGRLDWPDGDAQPRSIELPIATADLAGSDIRRLFVRLFDPTGGATLGGIAIASVFVDQPGAAGTLELIDHPGVTEDRGRALFVVERRGSTSGEARVDYATRPGTAEADFDFLPVSGILAWADGDGTARVIEIDLVTDAVAEPAEQFFLEFSDPIGAVMPRLSAAITIAASPGPPPGANPPPPTGGSSGGGGGSIGLQFLLLLTLTWLTMRQPAAIQYRAPPGELTAVLTNMRE